MRVGKKIRFWNIILTVLFIGFEIDFLGCLLFVFIYFVYFLLGEMKDGWF